MNMCRTMRQEYILGGAWQKTKVKPKTKHSPGAKSGLEIELSTGEVDPDKCMN